MPRLTVLREGRVERSLTLLGDDIAIGRMPGSALELAQPSVSRRHARLRREGTAWFLEDLGSMNGVLLGGRRIGRHLLSPKDSFAIEDYEIVFEPDDALYEAGLRQSAAPATGPQAFQMTYVSAGKFTAASRDR